MVKTFAYGAEVPLRPWVRAPDPPKGQKSCDIVLFYVKGHGEKDCGAHEDCPDCLWYMELGSYLFNGNTVYGPS